MKQEKEFEAVLREIRALMIAEKARSAHHLSLETGLPLYEAAQIYWEAGQQKRRRLEEDVLPQETSHVAKWHRQ